MRRSVPITTVLALAVLAGMAPRVGADVIVTGYFESSILHFTDESVPLAPIVPPGGTNGVLGPAGITFGPDGNLYVSNQASVFVPGLTDSIVKVDPTTGQVTPFITLASGYVPAGLRFGPDGNLYVSHNGGIAALQGSGSVDRYDGTTGAFIDSPVMNITQPTGLLFDSTGRLYVSCLGDADIVVFDGTNASLFVSPGSGGLQGPSGLQFGPDGNLYVVDLLPGAVRRYDPTGASLGDFIPEGGPLLAQFPSDLLFDHLGQLLVADLGGSPTDPEGGVKAFDAVTGNYVTEFAIQIVGASQLLLTP